MSLFAKPSKEQDNRGEFIEANDQENKVPTMIEDRKNDGFGSISKTAANSFLGSYGNVKGRPTRGAAVVMRAGKSDFTGGDEFEVHHHGDGSA